MRNKVMIILVALGCFVFMVTRGAKPLFSQGAPDFVLPTFEGKSLKFSDFQGKVIILNFWATHCPPCRQEIPDFIKLYDKYKDKGLAIIGVSLDRGNIENVKRFCQNKGINYPIVIGNYEVTRSYGGIKYIPTTFLIDKNGNTVKKFIGYTSIDVFEGELEELLK